MDVVTINVEDPLYFYSDDVRDTGVARSGKRLLIPRASLFEMRFDLGQDGSLLDVPTVVQDLVETANAQMPFQYRIDRDDDTFTLIATRTRDAQGRSIDLTPLLDRHVTISLGTRRIFEHLNLLTQAIEQQTGVRISWGPATVSGIWGSTVISFEARDEPARSVLFRLLRNEPGRERWHWMMRCQPGESWCFINLLRVGSSRG